MSLIPVATFTVACDACNQTLEDEDGGTLFTNPADIVDAARSQGWTALGDQHLCANEDATHQALVDRLMPPEPTFQNPGQLAIDINKEQS